MPVPDFLNGISKPSVKLMSGTTGMQIGPALPGEATTSFVSNGSIGFNNTITALANNNYVVILPKDEVNGVVNTGSAQLMNGATGEQVGDSILGNESSAGSTGGDLSNAFAVGSDDGSYYILAASLWDNNGAVDSGLVRIVTP